jgi:hypothetical protein
MKELKIGFTDKAITPWGGMILLKKMLEETGLKEVIEKCPGLPKPGSNRGYQPGTIIESFIASVWCGANRFLHTEVVRQDIPLGRIFEWERTPGQDVYKRYFGKFTHGINQEVFNSFYTWYFEQLQFDEYTIDFDSSVMTRYGEQEGAKRGYNPAKRGRASHHPLMAFVADCNMVANMWLRSGDASASGNFAGFIGETLERLQGKRVGLVRLDSGFYDKKIFTLLESKQLNYIVSAPMYAPLQRKLANETKWLKLEEGVEVSSGEYQPLGWDKPRRIIMVRQTIAERPKATGKQLRLFKNTEIYQRYRFSCLVTNITLPPAEVWRIYRHRAEAENKIKELKYDFGLDSFNMKSFYGTEATLNFVMLAYNLMSLFRHFIMNSHIQRRLSTLRFNTFAIGAYLIRNGNQVILKMALPLKRRKWFIGLWEKSCAFAFPVSFSNA